MNKYKNKLCSSVYLGLKCPYEETCVYAHKISELVLPPCKYCQNCPYVVKLNDKYSNTSSDIACPFLHPDENKIDYIHRVQSRHIKNRDKQMDDIIHINGPREIVKQLTDIAVSNGKKKILITITT